MIAAEQFDSLTADQVGMMLADKRVKEYPVFELSKGILTKKKIKYNNLDQRILNIRIQSERPDICTIKEKQLEIEPTSHSFIRLRILIPNNVKENTGLFEVTIYDCDTNLIHETLKFNYLCL